MIIKDLGAVSAYAYAVEKGYTGTEEEFATLMASYATIAEEAAESAESASQSAESASASASTATQKASEASTAAQTATAKAEETQADADAAALDASQALSAASTATTKASEAAQSASDAVTAKTAAQTAQTAAEGSATTAQTAAQTATQKAAEAAESARTLTIDPTLTQSGQAADSKVVGDEITGLKEDLKENNNSVILNTQYFNADTASGKGYDTSGTVIATKLNHAAIVYEVPCNADDVITYYGQGDHVYAAVVYFDASRAFIGYAQSTHSVAINTFTAPSNTAFIGVFSYNTPNFYFKIEARKIYGGIASIGTAIDEAIDTAIDTATNNAIDIRDELFDPETLGVNLYDTEKVVRGQYWQHHTLLENQSTNYATFGPIRVLSGTYKYNINYNLYGTNWKGCKIVDKDMNYIGTISTVFGENNEYMTFTINKTCYISLNCDPAFSHMLCLESKYPNSYVPYLHPVIDEAYLPEEEQTFAETNQLKGKKVIFDGDSICDGGSEVNTGETIAKDHRGWAGRIIDGNAMEGWNVGVGGGTITAELYSGTAPDLVPRHWLSRYIDTIHAQYPTLDYLIIEGGTNDADLLRPEIDTKFGTLSMTDWSGNYDDTTFTGALETLFYKALSYYPNTKIGYIVAQKMGRGNDYTKENNNRRIFFERAMDVCKKWGIPYINLWDGSPLNPRLDIYYDTSKDAQGNRDAGTAYIDGQHLTKEGYDIITPKIEQWMRGL